MACINTGSSVRLSSSTRTRVGTLLQLTAYIISASPSSSFNNIYPVCVYNTAAKTIKRREREISRSPNFYFADARWLRRPWDRRGREEETLGSRSEKLLLLLLMMMMLLGRRRGEHPRALLDIASPPRDPRALGEKIRRYCAATTQAFPLFIVCELPSSS